MNWLIREKMLTYFYNKFMPANCMHYMKWGVNSLVHKSRCCRRSVAPWMAVLSLHTVFIRVVMIYKFTLVLYSAKQGAQHRPTSHLACVHTMPFLRLREEHIRQQSCDGDFAGQCWLWQLLSRTSFVVVALSLPTNLGVA